MKNQMTWVPALAVSSVNLSWEGSFKCLGDFGFLISNMINSNFPPTSLDHCGSPTNTF